ncbi:uncharacterized protein LOC133791436 [Humulus lupulus]|uniref:uncharacterized protein LOC133791436 n=1 Tax=Humulus lupulus TaxID=3486 RepID=UPI002B40F419|nr:uncharacterized protein LOC133791436 [Humulus lupulus]
MNGGVQGSFKGEKGLRQGDLMSPLLFVLIMEYLTRSLQLTAQDSAFRFHPMCKSLKLLSLCFADDLILFCKGSLSTVRVLKVALEEFSSTTGLHINTSKSHIFFGGVSVADRQTIAAEIQLKEWTFPLKYLGVPMRPTKWKHEDCDIIIQKFKLRLHTWASRHLSFAGRIQLIHSVLFGLRNYWMSIFVLPETYGGLEFRNGSVWNRAIDSNFWTYKLPLDTSWYWRKLCNLRGKFIHDEVKATGASGKFQTSKLYNSTLCQQQVAYHHAVWCRLSIPKHRFCVPLESLLCPACGVSIESHSHLFFECYLSNKVTDIIFAWMGFKAWPKEFTGWTVWLASSRPGIFFSITNMILAAVIYNIWRNQNRCIYDGVTWTADCLGTDYSL